MKIEVLCLIAFGFTVFVQSQLETPTAKSQQVKRSNVVFVDKKEVEKVVKEIMKENKNEASIKE